MLAQEELSQNIFWKLIKPTLRQIESNDGVISIDDTIENKPYSDENELISWHFDHTKGISVKGINIVTFAPLVGICDARPCELRFYKPQIQ